MPDIIQQLKSAYISNPAEALSLMPEVIQQYDEGLINVLPCKVGDDVFTTRWNIKHSQYEVYAGKAKTVRYNAADGSVMISDGEFFRVFGESAFLTREAAEKALERET
jgi:hypothetical protein